MTMGERIKELREQKGLTQEELGKYIGVQKSAIRKYEKGEIQNLKRSHIKILADLFDVSPADLMCLYDNDSNIPKPFTVYGIQFDFSGLSPSDVIKISEFIEFIKNQKRKGTSDK